jgi:pimeloyl-ACP methyl ester carboxylesterase
LGDGRAILFGHDWGAPIVWNTALLYPNKVAAVAGLSVPYIPRGPVAFIDIAKAAYKERFFYQLYFQEQGVAEEEFRPTSPLLCERSILPSPARRRSTSGSNTSLRMRNCSMA